MDAGFQDELTNIMEDLADRIMEGDHNIISGVSKFIKAYQMMVKSHTPNSSISYALYNFGKSDSESMIFFFLLYNKITVDPSRDGMVQWKTWAVHKNEFRRNTKEKEGTEQRDKDGASKKANKAPIRSTAAVKPAW